MDRLSPSTTTRRTRVGAEGAVGVDEDPQAPTRLAVTMRQAIAWMVLDFPHDANAPLFIAAALLEGTALAGVARAQAYLPEDNLAYPVQVVVAGGGGTGFFCQARTRALPGHRAARALRCSHGMVRASELTLRALSKDVHERAVTVIHVNAAQLEDAKQIRADEPRDVAVVRLATVRPDGPTRRPAWSSPRRREGCHRRRSVRIPDALWRRDISSQIFMFGYPSVGVAGLADRSREAAGPGGLSRG